MPRSPTRRPPRERHATAAEARHAALAGDILRLAERDAWPPGHRLTELHLARVLAVSRTPVRAALRRLADQGFVSRHPDRGFVLAHEWRRLSETRLDTNTTAEAALHARLVRDRVAGVLAEAVTRTALLRRYQVGRPVLARVLARMEGEGLLAEAHGGGVRFAPTLASAEARLASFELRLAIEPAGLLSATFQPDHATIDRLRHEHTALLARLGRTPPREVEIFMLDESFHEQLARMSGNPFFLSAVRQQNCLRRLLEFGTYSDRDRLATWLGEHLAVLASVQAGAMAEAAALLRRHLAAAATAAKLEVAAEKRP